MSEHPELSPSQQPGIGRRLVAATLDLATYALLQVICSVFGAIVFPEPGPSTWRTILVLGWIYGAPLLVWSLWACRSLTIGERLLDIRIVCADESRPTAVRMGLRMILLLGGIGCLLIGPLSVLVSSQRRGLHNFVTGTFVIRRWPEGHCQSCGYGLRGLRIGRCPECGEPFDLCGEPLWVADPPK